MSHYYQDQIRSMAALVDYRILYKSKMMNSANEQPKVFDQDEVKTCDLPEGGPWFEEYSARRGGRV